MYAAFLPKLDLYKEVIIVKDFLSKKECAEVIALSLKVKPRDGTIKNRDKSIVDKTIRAANTHIINCNRSSAWLFERLDALVSQCNKKIYNFNLLGLTEELNIVRYDKSNHYIWHKDFSTGSLSRRKLSISIQLTDPLDYGGGELEFFLGNKDIFAAPKNQGTVIIFPSFQVHRVKPIVQGTRYSLVGWVNGPPFK